MSSETDGIFYVGFVVFTADELLNTREFQRKEEREERQIPSCIRRYRPCSSHRQD